MARRDESDLFWQIGTELQRLTDEIARSGRSVVIRKFWEPKIDLLDKDGCLVLKAELAGVRGDDMQVTYNPDMNAIQLKGLRREEDYSDIDRIGCYQLEIYYGEFEREVRLPNIPIDPSRMKAVYRNGMLIVLIPKVDQTHVETTITITRT